MKGFPALEDRIAHNMPRWERRLLCVTCEISAWVCLFACVIGTTYFGPRLGWWWEATGIMWGAEGMLLMFGPATWLHNSLKDEKT